MSSVLVIDDEPGITRFVQRALECDGLEVMTASNGSDGLRLALETAPDLVVLDLAMPGVNGEAVLAAVMAQRPGQRVLVLSAMGDVETRVRCIEQGAEDFLGKPFALRELVARVRRRLASDEVVQSRPYLTAGGLSLDLSRREAHYDNRAVPLSSREFLLLAYLMRHPDTVCTREMLLAEVWGYDFDPGTNVVDVYVRRLRLKLPEDAIRTVRNVGYQLQAA